MAIISALATGTAVANTPYLVATTDQAMVLFGRGSMLARMLEKYRANDSFSEIWCIAVADAGGADASTAAAVAELLPHDLSIDGAASFQHIISRVLNDRIAAVNGTGQGQATNEVSAATLAADIKTLLSAG